MKIAIMGIRGIPANYGGFETFAEHLSTRFVKKGHNVTVYGRSNVIDKKLSEYKGVRLVILPTIGHKYLDTVVHTLLSVLHSLLKRYDVVLICNAANAYCSWIPRLVRTKVVLNVDGIERKRKKWNKAGEIFYAVSEKLSTFLPNMIVTDADVIKKYYVERYRKDSVMIPYGAVVKRKNEGNEILQNYEVRPEEYVLYVSRLEPENNAHLVIKAFEKVQTDKKLLIVGDAPYAKEYISQLKQTKDSRIKFLGYVFGGHYQILQQNAYCYIQATEVGGTHPALLEALGFGNCVLALDVPEHREVIQDSGVFFKDVADLTEKLQMVLIDKGLVTTMRTKAAKRVAAEYSWDMVTTKYKDLFEELLFAKQKIAGEAANRQL